MGSRRDHWRDDVITTWTIFHTCANTSSCASLTSHITLYDHPHPCKLVYKKRHILYKCPLHPPPHPTPLHPPKLAWSTCHYTKRMISCKFDYYYKSKALNATHSVLPGQKSCRVDLFVNFRHSHITGISYTQPNYSAKTKTEIFSPGISLYWENGT